MSTLSLITLTPAMIDAVGLVAAVITTLCWLPQMIKTITTKDTSGISLWMQVSLNIGVTLWLLYGTLLGSWPLIGANLLTLMMTLTMLGLKLRYG
jgi:MtN3 and saliva related transmembrane protein